MQRLRKEIENRVERTVRVFANGVAADNNRAKSDRLADEIRAFMDGIVAAAAVCPDSMEDLRRIAETRKRWVACAF